MQVARRLEYSTMVRGDVARVNDVLALPTTDWQLDRELSLPVDPGAAQCHAINVPNKACSRMQAIGR
jgi:hypothetical protein